MEVYFNNDGSYGQSAVNAPIIVNGKPIGFICEVNKERITCYLWDRFVSKEQSEVSMCGEQYICSIRIEN